MINQIVVFDFNEYLQKLEDENNKQSAFHIDQNLESRMCLNFANNPSEKLNILISNSFKQVVFTDVKENFILEKKDGFSVQKKLT